jgi:hypothetical protein
MFAAHDKDRSYAGMHPDIVGRLIDQGAERGGGAASAALEHDPGVVALRLRPSGARDRVQDVLAGRVGGKAIGRIDVPEHADQGRTLIDQRNDGLRLDGAILQGIDDRFLNLRRRPAGGVDGAGIRHGDVALGVDVLVRQIDEVAGTNAGLGRDEEPTRRGLKDRHAHHVSDAEFDLPRRPSIGKHVADPGGVGCQHVDDPGCHLNEGIGETVRILRVPPAVDFTDLRPRGRHDGAAAQHGRYAQSDQTCENARPAHNATPPTPMLLHVRQRIWRIKARLPAQEDASGTIILNAAAHHLVPACEQFGRFVVRTTC